MIESIHIQNFKSIRDVSVDLSPVTILIGKSGAGKSNFLCAIRFLRNYLIDADQAAIVEGGWGRIYPYGSKAPTSISLRFSIPGYEKKFQYYLSWQPDPHQVRSFPTVERLSLGNEVIFARDERKWEKWPLPGQSSLGQPQIYLGTFPTISETVLAFTALTSGVGWYDFPAEVFRIPAPQKRRPDNGLNDSADNYLHVIRELTQNLQSQYARRQILSRVRQINSSITSLELDSIIEPQKVIVGHDVGGERIPLELAQESDGLRRYYAHLLALYQTPPKQVLMFEEPENGIYPGALHNLSEEFRSAAENGRGQILLTTQSPDLLDGFEPESIRVVDVDASRSTLIGSLDPTQLQAVRDRLLDPGELLTVDRARTASLSA